MATVTLTQRKEREAARRAEAVRAVMDRLRAFVEQTGRQGRFIVFGSVAAGAIRHSSDFDVLIDFPPGLESAAWTAVEEACRMADLREDILSTATTKPDFVGRIMARPIEVIG